MESVVRTMCNYRGYWVGVCRQNDSDCMNVDSARALQQITHTMQTSTFLCMATYEITCFIIGIPSGQMMDVRMVLTLIRKFTINVVRRTALEN